MASPINIDDEVDEKPTCHLRSLNDDCLCKIFEYLGNYEYVQLSRYDAHFNTIIKTMVVKRKLLKFRGCAVDFNKTCFRLYGDALRNILIHDCQRQSDADSVVWMFKSHLKSGELESLTIINKFSEGRKIREEHLLHMLRYTPNLKNLKYTDRIADCNMQIAKYCPNIEALDISYSGDQADYFSNFPNLKSASFVSNPKAYQILRKMAEKNTIEKVKIYFSTDFPPDTTPIEHFTSLKVFEVYSSKYEGFNFEWVSGLLPYFKNLEELVVSSERNQWRHEAINFLEMVPWINTYSIRKTELFQLPVAIRKLIRRICEIKSQQLSNGPIKKLHLILNIRQWREFTVIKNIDYEPFMRVSVKPTDFEIVNNIVLKN